MAKEILIKGVVAVVDDCDHALVAGRGWRLLKGKKTLYAYAKIGGRSVFMHRLIMGAKIERFAKRIRAKQTKLITLKLEQ